MSGMHRSGSSRKLAGIWGLAGAALLAACGGGKTVTSSAPQGEVEVVQVTTLTTVQASSGLFLSPSAQQNVPSYVARGELAPSAPADGVDRAKVDVALLFRSDSDQLPSLEAELAAPPLGEREPIEHYFPEVLPADGGARWPLELVQGELPAGAEVSSEWSGWQAFGGLRVRSPGSIDVEAPAATLDYELRGARSPLVLTLNDADELVVTNQSGVTVQRALLVYSHPGGVAVTAIDALGPGASRITTLGPKERPPEELLDRARANLAEFFSASVEPSLAEAMAASKSTPFLETQGFRLIALLDATQGPAALQVHGASVTPHQVVVSHSEILKAEEESRILSVVADTSLDEAAVAESLGRFAEGKLELATTSEDASVSERAQGVLARLRGR